MSVKDIITNKVISIDKNRKLSDAVNLMEKKRISRVVVTSDGEISGMLTEKDIAEHIGSARHGKSTPSSLHISTAMTHSIISITSDTTIEKAAKKMLKHGISSLPVLNDGKTAGIVTKTDIVNTLAASEKKLEEIMKTGVVTVSPNDRIVHARRLMLDNKIGRLVAVEDGDIEGVLTGMDTARALFNFKQATDKGYASRIRNIIVKEAMSPNVITLDTKTPVKDAIKIMKKHRFSGIPLTREGKLAGIVTKTNMLKIIK